MITVDSSRPMPPAPKCEHPEHDAWRADWEEFERRATRDYHRLTKNLRRMQDLEASMTAHFRAGFTFGVICSLIAGGILVLALDALT